MTHGVTDLGSADELPVNSVIFSSSALTDVDTATYYSDYLTSIGNTLTVVLVDPYIDQANYRKVPGLNVIVWSDPVTTINSLKTLMKCDLKLRE